MNWMLHSKLFKKNLVKWLLMYGGVILLFTSVITYSKYVSQMMSSDSARVAKFIIDIEPNNCVSSNDSNCNIGNVRPTKIDYYFTVDTSELEVNSDLILNIYLNRKFSFFNNNAEVLEIDGDSIPLEAKSRTSIGDNSYQIYQYSDKVNVSNLERKKIKKYKVSVKFNSDNFYTENFNDNIYDIVRVGYSLIQVKN